MNTSISDMRTISCLTVYVLSFCMLLSCRGTKDQGTLDYMAVTDSVSLQTVAIDKELLMPERLFVSGNNLVVYQPKEEEGLFTVFHLPFDGKGYRTGHTGRGPDEFLRIDIRSIVPDGDGFWVADNGDMTVKSVKLDAGQVRVTDRKKIDSSSGFNGMFEMEDCYINMNVFSDEYEYMVYDKQTGQSRGIIPYPDWYKGTEEWAPVSYYMNFGIPRPSGDLFAIFYAYFRKIQIADTEGRILKEVTLDFDGDISGCGPASSRKYIAFSLFPVATDDYVAVQYADRIPGRKRGDITEVQVWNWDGELLHRLIFDKGFGTFTIDPQTGILFATPFDDPQHLYTADLSGILL